MDLPLNHSPYLPLRCPSCGLEHWAFVGPWPSRTSWSHCPRCGAFIPAVVPGNLPPLFSWEVHPGLYPVPRWPRRPSARLRKALARALILAGSLLLVAAGAFGWVGGASATAPPQAVGGVVLGFNASQARWVPMASAVVAVTGSTTGPNVTDTNALGRFLFHGVSGGVHDVEASAPGYQEEILAVFLSQGYDSPSGNMTSLSLQLVPGPANQSRVISYIQYPDFETYLAFVFSATVLEGMAGALAVGGGIALWRRRSPARSVVAASAAALSPFLMAIAGFGTLFLTVLPETMFLVGGAGLLGAVTVVILLWALRPLGHEEIPAVP